MYNFNVCRKPGRCRAMYRYPGAAGCIERLAAEHCNRPGLQAMCLNHTCPERSGLQPLCSNNMDRVALFMEQSLDGEDNRHAGDMLQVQGDCPGLCRFPDAFKMIPQGMFELIADHKEALLELVLPPVVQLLYCQLPVPAQEEPQRTPEDGPCKAGLTDSRPYGGRKAKQVFHKQIINKVIFSVWLVLYTHCNTDRKAWNPGNRRHHDGNKCPGRVKN